MLLCKDCFLPASSKAQDVSTSEFLFNGNFSLTEALLEEVTEKNNEMNGKIARDRSHQPRALKIKNEITNCHCRV